MVVTSWRTTAAEAMIPASLLAYVATLVGLYDLSAGLFATAGVATSALGWATWLAWKRGNKPPLGRLRRDRKVLYAVCLTVGLLAFSMGMVALSDWVSRFGGGVHVRIANGVCHLQAARGLPGEVVMEYCERMHSWFGLVFLGGTLTGAVVTSWFSRGVESSKMDQPLEPVIAS